MTRRDFMAAIGAFAAVTPGLAALINARPKAIPKAPARPRPRDSRFGDVPFDPKTFEARCSTRWLRDEDVESVFNTHYKPPILLNREIHFSLVGYLQAQDACLLHSCSYGDEGVLIRVVAPRSGHLWPSLVSLEFRAFVENLVVSAGSFQASGFVLPSLDGTKFQIELA